MSVFSNPANGAAEHAPRYIRAVLDLLGTRDPLEVLWETPFILATVLEESSGPEISRPEAPGKWSVGQVLAHLADSELVWGYRLRRVLAEDRPVLHGYDQDLWADRLDYSTADPAASLERFTVLRESHLTLLEGLSPADGQRAGVHPERGEETVTHMLRLYAGHDLVHLRQVTRILSSD